MRISHVIRGEDHVSNTPKHILLFEALGYPLPVFAHLPLILNPDGTKMSKRKSQTAVADYIAQGFMREALVNYFAFLGWSPGTEEDVLSLDEIIERFELDKVQKGGARFDRERLEWLNGQWIRRLDDDDLVERLLPFLEAAAAAGRDRPGAVRRDELRALLPIVRERLPTLAAIVRHGGLPVARRARGRSGAARAQALGRGDDREGLAAAREVLAAHDEVTWEADELEPPLRDAGRGPRLEGRRPVHGDPGRDDRADRDAAAVRHAGRPGPRADAGPIDAAIAGWVPPDAVIEYREAPARWKADAADLRLLRGLADAADAGAHLATSAAPSRGPGDRRRPRRRVRHGSGRRHGVRPAARGAAGVRGRGIGAAVRRC